MKKKLPKTKSEIDNHAKTKSLRKPNTAIVIALIGLVGTISAALINSPILVDFFTLTPVPTDLDIISTELQLPTPTLPSTTYDPHPDSLDYVDAYSVSMHLVPAGEFTMGRENGADGEKPAHVLYLDAFYIDKYEVTNILYRACVDVGVCTKPKYSNSFTHSDYYTNSTFDNYPVIFVDWAQAKTYCEWRGGSLPTEAQWEKAARGTENRTYPWGEKADCEKANYCNNDVTRVGSYENEKSPYGIYDLGGNVWEWVADWYLDTYYQDSPSSNPLGPVSGQYRVLRGGAWSYDETYMRTSNRGRSRPDYTDYYVGFRCVRPLP